MNTNIEVIDGTEILIDESVAKAPKKYPSLMVITENGYGKHTHLAEFRKTGRGGKGVKTLNVTTKTGKPVLVHILKGDEESLIVTTRRGITINIHPKHIPQSSRVTQGVRLIRLSEEDKVVSAGVN